MVIQMFSENMMVIQNRFPDPQSPLLTKGLARWKSTEINCVSVWQWVCVSVCLCAIRVEQRKRQKFWREKKAAHLLDYTTVTAVARW